MLHRLFRIAAVPALALSLALVGEVLVVPPEPAAAATGRDVDQVPGITSDALTPVVPTTPLGTSEAPDSELELAPRPTEEQPLELAPEDAPDLDELAESDDLSYDPDTSDVVARSTFQETYENEDGTNSIVMSETPRNVKRGNGKWVPISTDVDIERDGSGAVEDHPLDPQFAEKASDDGVLTISRGKYSIAYSLDGAADSELSRSSVKALKRDKDVVEYRDVFPDQDLRYTVSNGAVKEEIILGSVPSGSRDSWTWRVDADGLAAQTEEDGTITFRDPNAQVVFAVPAPRMYDSSGVMNVREPADSMVPTTVERDGSSWKITLTPDRAWLTDPERQYPVYVDPSSAVSWSNDQHAFSSTGPGINDGIVRLGNSRDRGDRYWRTVTHFDYEKLFGKQVLGARVEGFRTGGASALYTGSIRYATAFSYNGVGNHLSNFPLATNNYAGDPALAKQIAAWVRAKQRGAYLMLRGQETPGAYTYKELDAALVVDYKDFPTAGVPIIPSAANGSRASSAPRLKVSARDPEGSGLLYAYHVGTTTDPSGSLVWDSGWGAQERTVPWGKLQGGRKYYWRAYVKDGYDGHLGTSTKVTSSVFSFTANRPALSSQAGATPSDGTVVTTTTPTLSVPAIADGDGDKVTVNFTIATGEDASTGTVVSSGWQSGTSWKVPEGSLEDGGRYTWTVRTHDGYDKPPVLWKNVLTVNKRIGESGPAPTDTAGPVTVNLANGNVGLRFASPTVNALGGEMGLSFSYNSQQVGVTGLTGSYYDVTPKAGGTADRTFTGKTPVLVRADPALSFDWGTESPAPAVPKDDFLARWTGFITVPKAGKYTFHVSRDDGARLWVDGQKLVDQWVPANTESSSSAVTMPGRAVPIRLEYFEAAKTAMLSLSVTDPDGKKFVVPSSWFSRSVTTLPAGWSSSSALAGDEGEWASARQEASAVILTDTSGTTHTHSKTGGTGVSTAYKAPAGEYDQVALDRDGRVTVTGDDGTVTVFAANGRVDTVTGPGDALKSATPITIRRSNGAIDRIVDPLSKKTDGTFGRQVRFAYAGDSAAAVGLDPKDSNSTGTACPVPSAFAAPPADMLCRIVYPDHRAGEQDTTQLFYDDNGNLARILDPGDEMTDLGYEAGKLTTLRDPLANDWLAADSSRVADDDLASTIAYDAVGRAVSVTLPAADGATRASRQVKTYTYADAHTTHVDVPALGLPSGTHANTVTYDDAWRQTRATSPSGLQSTTVWNERDLQLSSTDQAGRMSTTLYDANDRAVDEYGPAPAACFDADRRPTAACAASTPRTSTAYDEGLRGLNATWYANERMAGAPKAYSLGVGNADGAVHQNWAGAPPAAGVGFPADNWSVRLSGRVTAPVAGDYVFVMIADDGVQLFIDDLPVVDAWGGPATTSSRTFRFSAGQSAKIRIQFREAAKTATLSLQWKINGGTTTAVPGSALSPDYGLATSTTTWDTAPAGIDSDRVHSLVKKSEFADPWLGTETASVVDPGGLALRETTTHEKPGTGYLRRLSRNLPAQNPGGATTSAYFGDTQTLKDAYGLDAVCGVPGSTPQYGALKSATGAKPAVGDAIVTSYAYDVMGRTVGTRRSGDSDWSCTTFDERGRTVTTTTAAFGAEQASAERTSYSRDGLTTTVADALIAASTNGSTVTTTSDLLGRVTRYEDVLGTVTTTTYDAAGRVASATAVTPDRAQHVTAFEYDIESRPVVLKLDGEVVAKSTYTGSELTSVTYPKNGTALAAIQLDGAGATVGLDWSFPNGQPSVTDRVVRSQAGNVLLDTTTHGSATDVASYGYDTAGRLVAASVPRHRLTYGFGPSACTANGSVVAAGANGNRTTASDTVLDVTGQPAAGTPTTSTSYCYDAADRLLSTSVVNPVPDAAPVSSSIDAAYVKYDAHGNTVRLADQALSYDGADRHTETQLDDGTHVSYKRDATDRIVQRIEGKRGSTDLTTTRYGFTGDGDTPDFVYDADGRMTEWTVSLPGGVLASLRPEKSTWSYPNIHGDVVVTTDGAGLASEGLVTYDPFGQVLDQATGLFGTRKANTSGPDNQDGNADYGWLGQHQRLSESAGTISTIEMGARQYVGALGRFLQVDSVEGGTDNDYAYVNDPVGDTDLDGNASRKRWYKRVNWGLVADVASIGLMFVPGGALVSGVIWAFRIARVVRAASAYTRGVSGARSAIKASRATSRVAGRVFTRSWQRSAVRKSARNGAPMIENGRRAYRAPWVKGKSGRSSNFTYSTRGRHDYRNFHVNHRYKRKNWR